MRGSVAARLLPIRWIPREAPVLNPPSTLGRAALEVARVEIGNGEAIQNNHGPDVVRYRRGIDDGGPWCAAFLAWCIEEAAHHLGLGTCPVRRSHSARTRWRRAAAAGAVVEHPRAGDLGLWTRTGGAHIGILDRIETLNNRFWSVEGNKGGFPSLVDEYKHPFGEPHFLGWARLPMFRRDSVAP